VHATTASCSCAFSWASSAGASALMVAVCPVTTVYRGYDRIEVVVGDGNTRRRGRAFLRWGRHVGLAEFWPSPPSSLHCPSAPDTDCCSKRGVVNNNQIKSNQSTVIMPTTLKEFESVWPRIVADLQDHCKGYNLPKQSLDWFTKVLP
jgi:hypothetical protein